MLAKEDFFDMIGILRELYAAYSRSDQIGYYIKHILEILENDSGKIWGADVFAHCMKEDYDLEQLWADILKCGDIKEFYGKKH